MKKVAVIAVCVCVALLIMGIVPPGISILTSVPSGATGILVSFGEVQETHLDPGFHVKLPWQRVVVMDNRVQTMKIATGVKNATITDTAETRDQQLIPVFSFEVQYRLNADKSFELYEEYGEDYEDMIVKPNAVQVIKNVFVKFKADEITQNKESIPTMIKDALQALTSPFGVDIVRVTFETYDFTSEYSALLEEKALIAAELENTKLKQTEQSIAAQTAYDVAIKEAEREAEIARIENETANKMKLAEAEAEAEKERVRVDNAAYVTRTQAEADRDARLAAAEAEKAELEAKASGLNELVIRSEAIDKWNGQLMPTFGDTGIGFTDYTEIIKQYLETGGGSSDEE